MGNVINVYKILMRNSIGDRPLWRYGIAERMKGA
jgi:hypothetical protein